MPLLPRTGPGTSAIFQKKGTEMLKTGKMFENLNFKKGQVTACGNRAQKTARIDSITLLIRGILLLLQQSFN